MSTWNKAANFHQTGVIVNDQGDEIVHLKGHQRQHADAIVKGHRAMTQVRRLVDAIQNFNPNAPVSELRKALQKEFRAVDASEGESHE